MARYIDAEKLVANKFKNDISYKAFCNLVDRQPTADVAPVRRGEWVYKPAYKGASFGVYICSCCEAPFWWNNMNYCPNCGAKMDGGAG